MVCWKCPKVFSFFQLVFCTSIIRRCQFLFFQLIVLQSSCWLVIAGGHLIIYNTVNIENLHLVTCVAGVTLLCNAAGLVINLKAWPHTCNISTQHLATLLHDVATCVEGVGKTHPKFSSFSTQHENVHVPQAPGAQEVDLTRMSQRNNVA